LPDLVLACALGVEERAARRGGARTVRVGLGAGLRVPDEPCIAFGFAGALTPRLRPGTLVTATRLVAEDGSTLWEGAPALAGAEPAVLCAVTRIVDDREERAALAASSGAVAVDMESGVLAATGRLRGVVRAISDAPDRPVGRLAFAATRDGGVAWGAVFSAFAREPVVSVRTARAGRRALAALEHAAAALASFEHGR
jgi:adenosylhomocysteine nucleosidase